MTKVYGKNDVTVKVTNKALSTKALELKQIIADKKALTEQEESLKAVLKEKGLALFDAVDKGLTRRVEMKDVEITFSKDSVRTTTDWEKVMVDFKQVASPKAFEALAKLVQSHTKTGSPSVSIRVA